MLGIPAGFPDGTERTSKHMAKNTFPAKAGSNDYFIAFVPSVNVKAGDALEYTRKDGQVLHGTAKAVLGQRMVSETSGCDVVFAKIPKAPTLTKADLEAALAAKDAQIAALLAATKAA